MSEMSGGAPARPRGAGWSEEADAVIGGDLATALAYATPAGGAVVAPITTSGVRDREAGTVTLTTSLAFGRKLERIRRANRVALAFHAREHGFAEGPSFVLVQGRASIGWAAEREERHAQRAALGGGMMRFFGMPRQGRFWAWWMREYYLERVPVTVGVERVSLWADPAAGGVATVHGTPPPAAAPGPQDEPRGGAGPRLPAPGAGRRLRRLPHLLLGWVGADGYPAVAPVSVAGEDREGLDLLDPSGAVPPGERRAGLVGHDFGPGLTGLRVQQHTGWLRVSGDGIRYAPHTEHRNRTPRGSRGTQLVNGGRAKLGLRRERRAGNLEGGR